MIHSSRFIDNTKLTENLERIKFNKKISKTLIVYAVNYVKNAKDIHDQLEKYYINSMDFVKLNTFTNEFIESILN